MTDLRSQLQASLGSNYSIERELGGGGMSRVFLATDQTLDRAVVVKVLSGEYSAGVSADRFRREIQVIARLQHPHVVPILSAGSAEGALYYVMPFLGGETLRARLSRERVMSVPDSARVLRELLDALAFAHSHGVIHRDIKPENILVEAGHAVVADFGIAKALKESSGLTSVGVSVGTPAYMAPEQAAADPAADHRVDLYAVGCVAYEMLCGEPPFTGSPQQVLRAHMVEDPRPLRERRSDVPEALAALVMRALEKEPSARPQSAIEMLTALEAVTTPGTQSTPATLVRPVLRPTSRPIVLGGAGLLTAALAFVVWRATQPTVLASAQSLMVAPFSVATGDTTLVRLGQNLVTTVSANLDGVGDIRATDAVASLSHAKSKGALLSAADAMEIGRKLGAKSVLHGTLAPTGATVRADAVLYDVVDGSQLGRVSVTAPADSLTALTDSLTWQVLRAVWRGKPPTPNVSSITTHSPVALREFLEGERQFARQEFSLASEAYRRAIAADTTFWFAYYRNRLVRSWVALPADTQLNRKLSRHRHELPERERALITMQDSTMPQSARIRAYRRLTELYPEYAPAHVTYADYLIHHAVRSGYSAGDALEPWRRVAQLMPSDVSAADHVIWACLDRVDLECARNEFVRYDSMVRADPSLPGLTRSQHRTFLHALAPERPALTDSVLRVSDRDSTLIGFVGAARYAMLVMTPDRPLVPDWDRMLRAGQKSIGSMGPLASFFRFFSLAENVARGDARALDSLMTMRLAGGQSPTAALRVRVTADLIGLTTADSATSRAAAAIAQTPGLTNSQRADANWIVGFNALMRGDSAGLGRALAAAAADTSTYGRIIGRSLRAIRLGRTGQRAAAAESLLAVERPHGEDAPKVYSAFAVDRLLGAQWLAEEKRYDVADSLLRFVSSFVVTTHAEAVSAVGVPALLVKSRIYEGLGNNDMAVRHALAFMAAFDKAPPSHKALIDEARDRVARLRPSDTRRGR